jgi:hypothetical protein
MMMLIAILLAMKDASTGEHYVDEPQPSPMSDILSKYISEAVDKSMEGMRSFVRIVQSIPDKVNATSIDMATAIKDKIDEYAEGASGKNIKPDDNPDMVIIMHKQYIDSIRSDKRKLYDMLLEFSSKTRVLSNDQLIRLSGAI